jgi:predicted nucleic acid-binding protein
MIYADSSFMASMYALDGNTEAANDVYQADRRRPMCFTVWQELELFNTFRLGVSRARRRGLAPTYQIGNCLKRVREDLRDGLLRREGLDWEACARRAATLSERFTESLGVVMLDVWQVACAAELGADTFWTFDSDQYELARACGQFKKTVGPPKT